MKGNKINFAKGMRKELLDLLLTCGVVPQKSLFLLGNPYIYARKLRRMVKEGICEEVIVKRKHVFILKDFTEKSDEYIEYHRTGVYGYYLEYGFTNALDIKKPAKKNMGFIAKAYRQGLISSFFYKTSILSTADERPRPSEIDNIKNKAYFFTSSEIKGKKDDPVIEEKYIASEEKRKDGTIRIYSSRAAGGLLSPGGIYNVYMATRKVAWVDKSEATFARYLYIVATTKGIQTKDNQMKTIIICQNSNIVKEILDNEDRRFLTCTNTSMDRIYTIPYNSYGQFLVETFSEVDWEKKMIHRIDSELNLDTARLSVDCDAIDKDERYYYFFTTCDVIRFNKFIRTAIWANEPSRYIIYCFDWQTDIVKQYTKNAVTIYEIPFEDYMKVAQEEKRGISNND